MILPLTENYIANKFYQNCGKPFYNRQQKVYQGSCPICREGKSWLKKRRCYYIVDKNAICCHNCGWYSNPYNWIVKVTGLNFKEIKKDLEEYSTVDFTVIVEKSEITKPKIVEALPSDSINLFDPNQVEYYKQNNTVKAALKLIDDRKIFNSINKPKTLFVSLNDKIHSNRLIIPFYDISNKIVFYQSRKIFNDDEGPKYLSKVGSEKTLYGIDNIDPDLGYIFIIEGPIDAMFVRNGVGVGGINESKSANFTNMQQTQLKSYPLLKRIWVLDNQTIDKTSKLKTNLLVDQGETVFIWPKKYSKNKDINDYCIENDLPEIDTNFILDNCYSNLKAKLILSNY